MGGQPYMSPFGHASEKIYTKKQKGTKGIEIWKTGESKLETTRTGHIRQKREKGEGKKKEKQKVGGVMVFDVNLSHKR